MPSRAAAATRSPRDSRSARRRISRSVNISWAFRLEVSAGTPTAPACSAWGRSSRVTTLPLFT